MPTACAAAACGLRRFATETDPTHPPGPTPAFQPSGISGQLPPPHPTASTFVTVLYQDTDHLDRLWTVTIDIPQPKDPPATTRVAFHAYMADNSRDYINLTSLWTPGIGWGGPWTPTRPRSVPPAVREAVEAALRQRQEVA